MAIKKKLIEELLEGEEASEVFSADGLFAQLKKALAERILNAEMDEHLKADGQAGEGNHRNRYSPKTVVTDEGPLELDIPRDRQGRFGPQLIALTSLFVAGICHAASARSGLLLLSRGDHFSVMQTSGSASREVIPLGSGVVYGESADAFVFVSYQKQTGVYDAEILDKKTRAIVWSHPVSGNPIEMLDGPSESVVITAKAIYFVSYPAADGGPEGVFHLNVVSRQDGVQKIIPIPSTIGWNLARDGAGAPVLRAREGDGLWRFNEVTGAPESTVGPSGLRRLQDGDGSAIKLFPASYRGALAVGVLRLHDKKPTSLAYVDPVKNIQLWEKPLAADMMPGSAFAAADGWNYFINSKTGAVTGLSGEPGTREIWKLPTEGNYLYEARILAIDD